MAYQDGHCLKIVLKTTALTTAIIKQVMTMLKIEYSMPKTGMNNMINGSNKMPVQMPNII